MDNDRDEDSRKAKAGNLTEFFEALKAKGLEISNLKDMVFSTYVYGLQIIREVNKSRRIDRQADGRAARQKNPGEAWSVFSLDGDDLAMLERGLYYTTNAIDRLFKTKINKVYRLKRAIESGEKLTGHQKEFLRKAWIKRI